MPKYHICFHTEFVFFLWSDIYSPMLGTIFNLDFNVVISNPEQKHSKI